MINDPASDQWLSLSLLLSSPGSNFDAIIFLYRKIYKIVRTK